jgi:acylaminoacyl-peptidase
VSCVDWCFVEALGTEAALKYSQNSKNGDDFNTMPDEKDLLKMRECSPIIYAKNVRAPVLMLIGGKDRRVPMSQGVSYYHNLKAKGTNWKSRMCIF